MVSVPNVRKLVKCLGATARHFTVCFFLNLLLNDVTYTFRAFSRRFYPNRLPINRFVRRRNNIYRCRYSKKVQSTKKVNAFSV